MINEDLLIESRKIERVLSQIEACSRALRAIGFHDEAKFVDTASSMVNAHHYELIENFGPIVKVQL